MTLILTVISNKAVVQVTDRRLTSGTKIEDELANKSIVTQCKDARFVMSYTGYSRTGGKINGRMTDWWAGNCLNEINAWNMPIVDVIRVFGDRLRAEFRSVKPVTFVFAGYAYKDFKEKQHYNSFMARTTSSGNYYQAPILKKMNVTVLADGAAVALTTSVKEKIARSVSRKMLDRGRNAIIDGLVPLVREVSLAGGLGHTIGPNCMSLAMTHRWWEGADFYCHTSKVSTEANTPLIVGPPGLSPGYIEILGSTNPAKGNISFGRDSP